MAVKEITAFEYTRAWFNFAFENQHRVRAIHTAMYMWFIELKNRMGWVDYFGSPSSQTMAACGGVSYNTYKKAFDELIEFGFIEVIKQSTNQHYATVIALSKIDKATVKALDRALITQMQNTTTVALSKIDKATVKAMPLPYQKLTGQATDSPINISQSNCESNCDLIKPQTTNQIKEDKPQLNFFFSSEDFKSVWAEWLEYKAKQHRFKFKTIKSQQQSLKLLFRESHESEAIAISMLEYAMAKGWIGWVMKEDKNFYVTRKKESNDQNDMVF